MTLTPDLTASTVLGKLLGSFLRVLSAGMVRSIPEMLWLLRMLATLELMLAATAWHRANEAVFERFFWKLMGVVVLMHLVDGWKYYIDHVRDGFIQAGLFIGDNAISLNDFTDPGNIIDFGFSVTAVVFQRIKNLSWWSQSSEILYSGLGAMFTVLFYFVMAAAVFKAMLEYYIVCACGIFLVPFVAFDKTAFMGERVFSTIVAHAVRLMVLATILNIALPVLYDYKLPADPEMQSVWLLCGLSFVLMVVGLSAQALASGFVHGTPSLGWHNLVHGATSFTQTTAAIGAVGLAASYAGGRLVESAVRAGTAVSEAAHLGMEGYRAAHPTTHASRQGRLATHTLGAAQGVAQYGFNALASGFRKTVAEGRVGAHRQYHNQP